MLGVCPKFQNTNKYQVESCWEPTMEKYWSVHLSYVLILYGMRWICLSSGVAGQ